VDLHFTSFNYLIHLTIKLPLNLKLKEEPVLLNFSRELPRSKILESILCSAIRSWLMALGTQWL